MQNCWETIKEATCIFFLFKAYWKSICGNNDQECPQINIRKSHRNYVSTSSSSYRKSKTENAGGKEEEKKQFTQKQK